MDLQPTAHRSGDRWVITTTGYEINCFLIDEAISIRLANGPSTAMLRIEEAFHLMHGETQCFLRAGQFAGIEHLFALLHRPIISATVGETGRLDLAIDGGAYLVVEPDQQYEAWTLSADNGLLVVCLPGGGVGVWTPSSESQSMTVFRYAYTYGDAVRIAATAPVEQRPGSIASVCGMRTVPVGTADGGQHPENASSDTRLYLVEFADGSSVEIAEEYLGPVEEE